ncbi:hypothetical protein E2542_SST26426 [Spatholobus suberectus]|nr:hypothetical protein E2542_SST26426 [Spatholobus suberectus]
MRFFVACFGAADPTDPAAATKPLVPPPSRTLRRSKSHWRPALRSISEDTAPPHRERATAASAGDAKRTNNSATATAKVHRRQYGDDYDYGRVVMPAIMPGFSPTPFIHRGGIIGGDPTTESVTEGGAVGEGTVARGDMAEGRPTSHEEDARHELFDEERCDVRTSDGRVARCCHLRHKWCARSQ